MEINLGNVFAYFVGFHVIFVIARRRCVGMTMDIWETCQKSSSATTTTTTAATTTSRLCDIVKALFSDGQQFWVHLTFKLMMVYASMFVVGPLLLGFMLNQVYTCCVCL
jgi:hypothetical protein